MKKLNQSIINTIMIMLITINEKTSNLTIKETARFLGFSATQEEVRNFVNDIFVNDQDVSTEAIPGIFFYRIR
jgi:hypothetical protein